MNCMEENKHQTSIAPTLQRNGKKVSLALYVQFGGGGGEGTCGTFMLPDPLKSGWGRNEAKF